MQKNVKIFISPFHSNVEIVNTLVMTVHVPYSVNDVTMQFNPNIQDYKAQADQPGAKIRQVTFSTSTPDTKTLLFDFKTNNIHDVSIDNIKYNIKLMNIGKEPIQGQDFLYFEFLVTWD